MKSEDIFAMGLGLHAPWEVKSVSFEETQDGKELHIHIDFSCGARFINDKGDAVSAYDTEEKEWRHLNFFEHRCYQPADGEHAWAVAVKALVGALAVILLCLKELVVEVNVVLASLRKLPCGQQQLDEQLVQFLSRVEIIDVARLFYRV